MIKTEKQFWQKLKRDFKCWPHYKFTRIETATKNGVPDIFYTNGDINGWIELKVMGIVDWCSHISMKSLKLSANQIKWLMETPNSFILVALKVCHVDGKTVPYCTLINKDIAIHIDKLRPTYHGIVYDSPYYTVTQPFLVNIKESLDYPDMSHDQS